MAGQVLPRRVDNVAFTHIAGQKGVINWQMARTTGNVVLDEQLVGEIEAADKKKKLNTSVRSVRAFLSGAAAVRSVSALLGVASVGPYRPSSRTEYIFYLPLFLVNNNFNLSSCTRYLNCSQLFYARRGRVNNTVAACRQVRLFYRELKKTKFKNVLIT